MNYHGIMLAYDSSLNQSFDSMCTLNRVTISGRSSTNPHDIMQDNLRAVVIKINQTTIIMSV